jgi:alkanesulfonate monooxygenase SsuD/methylene tetrahydromethanopterin reductase-like flavin-dependent oxidoreductase (luciferase family)
MATFGYTLMTEENGPGELVTNARRAEEMGFDFLVSSDHYHPWVPHPDQEGFFRFYERELRDRLAG